MLLDHCSAQLREKSKIVHCLFLSLFRLLWIWFWGTHCLSILYRRLVFPHHALKLDSVTVRLGVPQMWPGRNEMRVTPYLWLDMARKKCGLYSTWVGPADFCQKKKFFFRLSFGVAMSLEQVACSHPFWVALGSWGCSIMPELFTICLGWNFTRYLKGFFFLSS